MNLLSWLPTIVNGLLVTLVIYFLKMNRENILERVGNVKSYARSLEARIADDENRLLTEEKHDLLCRNNCLEIKAYISEALAVMQKQNQQQFEVLKGLIQRVPEELDD